ncbi:hypothetical protein M3649_03205 [Ureibacillus chungkukjangi]|uniref:hypothetical protein n=1 Tax=Ureibacillus chungkukjangi TaxID=1202712 RepID=UPI00203DD058|nr:hypothetical protein [Ureibacillus chungkukjangi]MCM3387139.1 hypothetical protein [Ureibacillus chungkukjangi]
MIRVPEESDWLDISIPLAFLKEKYQFVYPIVKRTPELANIDELFIKLTEIIYKKSPFELAMLGEEVSGFITKKTITKDSLDRITCILPIELQQELAVLGNGEILSNGLLVI